MAYTPTEWQCGDVVTAEKLNNIEDGIEECDKKIMVVHITGDEQSGYRSDKTCDEMRTAILNNDTVLVAEYADYYYYMTMADVHGASEIVTRGLLRTSVGPWLTFQNIDIQSNYIRRDSIDFYDMDGECEIQMSRVTKQPLTIRLQENAGTCDGNSYSETVVTYEQIGNAVTDGETIYFIDAYGRHTAIEVHLEEVGNYYHVVLTFAFEAIIEKFHLYSDTVDGSLRNFNCWGGAA